MKGILLLFCFVTSIVCQCSSLEESYISADKVYTVYIYTSSVVKYSYIPYSGTYLITANYTSSNNAAFIYTSTTTCPTALVNDFQTDSSDYKVSQPSTVSFLVTSSPFTTQYIGFMASQYAMQISFTIREIGKYLDDSDIGVVSTTNSVSYIGGSTTSGSKHYYSLTNPTNSFNVSLKAYGYQTYIRRGDLPTTTTYDRTVSAGTDSIQSITLNSCSPGLWFFLFVKSSSYSSKYYVFNTTAYPASTSTFKFLSDGSSDTSFVNTSTARNYSLSVPTGYTALLSIQSTTAEALRIFSYTVCPTISSLYSFLQVNSTNGALNVLLPAKDYYLIVQRTNYDREINFTISVTIKTAIPILVTPDFIYSFHLTNIDDAVSISYNASKNGMTMLFATSPPGFNAYLSNYKIPTKANNYLSNWRAAVTTKGLGVDYYCSDVTPSYEGIWYGTIARASGTSSLTTFFKIRDGTQEGLMTALSGNTTGTVRESMVSVDYSHYYRFTPPSQSQTLISVHPYLATYLYKTCPSDNYNYVSPSDPETPLLLGYNGVYYVRVKSFYLDRNYTISITYVNETFPISSGGTAKGATFRGTYVYYKYQASAVGFQVSFPTNTNNGTHIVFSKTGLPTNTSYTLSYTGGSSFVVNSCLYPDVQGIWYIGVYSNPSIQSDSIGFSFTITDLDITTIMALTTTSTSYSIAPATPYYFYYSGTANTMVTMTISGTQTAVSNIAVNNDLGKCGDSSLPLPTEWQSTPEFTYSTPVPSSGRVYFRLDNKGSTSVSVNVKVAEETLATALAISSSKGYQGSIPSETTELVYFSLFSPTDSFKIEHAGVSNFYLRKTNYPSKTTYDHFIDSNSVFKRNETIDACSTSGVWIVGVSYDGTKDNSNFYIKAYTGFQSSCNPTTGPSNPSTTGQLTTTGPFSTTGRFTTTGPSNPSTTGPFTTTGPSNPSTTGQYSTTGPYTTTGQFSTTGPETSYTSGGPAPSTTDNGSTSNDGSTYNGGSTTSSAVLCDSQLESACNSQFLQCYNQAVSMNKVNESMCACYNNFGVCLMSVYCGNGTTSIYYRGFNEGCNYYECGNAICNPVMGPNLLNDAQHMMINYYFIFAIFILKFLLN